MALKPYVSKLMGPVEDPDTSAASEYARSRLMMQKDPDHIYSVSVSGWCQPAFGPGEKELYTTACKMAVPIAEQILYEFGGENDIHSTVEKGVNSVANTLQLLTNILQGIVIMNQAPGIVHMDIKQANIVFDPDTNTVRLIDYGFVRRHKDLITDQSPLLLEHSYEAWPPEWDMLHTVLKLFYRTVWKLPGDDIRMVLPDKRGTNEALGAAVLLSYAGLRHAPYQSDVMLTQYMERHPVEDCTSVQDVLDAFSEDFANKLDVYSLGIAMARLAGRRCPAGLQPLINAWILKATDPNAYTRFTPEEALRAYRSIWNPEAAAAARAPPKSLVPPRSVRDPADKAPREGLGGRTRKRPAKRASKPRRKSRKRSLSKPRK
jgi:serine/threonine protein kinase